jgi:hypothetical protein
MTLNNNSNKVSGEVIGLPACDVVYPLLISLHGETKRGKTFFASSFPNAFLIDFPPIKMKFGKVEIDKAALTRTVGEGFRSLFMPIVENGVISWIPKIGGFNYQIQYNFVKSWDMFQETVEKAKMFAESLDPKDGRVWVVIDDTYRWRGLEVLNWQAKNSNKWPAAQQFGQITQFMQGELTAIQEFANVVLVNRMVKNFETGEYGAQIYPTGSDYLADASLEITEEVRDNKLVQLVKVCSNGHDKSWISQDYCYEVLNPAPTTVLEKLKIPKVLW